MYSISIPLNEMAVKGGRQDELYHQVTAYDHTIAYARLTFVVIDMEAMIIFFAARKTLACKNTL